MRHQLLSPFEFFFGLPEVSDLADICITNQDSRKLRPRSSYGRSGLRTPRFASCTLLNPSC
jgi:hypothetical protein